MAQSLFDRARALMTEGHYAEACPLLAESQKLDPGGGTLLNLALCHEKEGRIATAWPEYQEALSLAIRDGRDDRKQIATERIAALDGKIPKVSFELPQNVDASTLTLAVDGAEIPKLALSAPLPIDPGEHTLVANAPGFSPRSQRFSVNAAEAKRVRIAALDPLKPVASAQPPPAPVAPIVSAAPPAPSEKRPSKASLIIGGVGGVALLGSGITGVMALIANSQSKDHVDNAGCVPSRDYCKDQDELAKARSDRDRARTLAWVSTGALVVGAAAVTTALLLPRESVSPGVRPSAGFVPARHGFVAGAGLSGAF